MSKTYLVFTRETRPPTGPLALASVSSCMLRIHIHAALAPAVVLIHSCMLRWRSSGIPAIRTPGFGLDLTRGSQTSQDVLLALAGHLEAAEGVHGPQLPREVLLKSSSSCTCDECGKRFHATKSRAYFALNRFKALAKLNKY